MPKKSKSQPTPPFEDEPSSIDILVDVIIGFLENASAFTRSVANESFSRVTSAVQGSTVDLILNVSDGLFFFCRTYPTGRHDGNSLAIGAPGSK